jgi:uncharacterized protein
LPLRRISSRRLPFRSPCKRGERLTARAFQGRLLDARTGRVLIARLVRARGPLGRTVGLLGRSSISDDEAMWFDACAQIHTLGMRMPIDVLFLDESGAVIRVVAAAGPWRPWIGAPGACSVIELAGGACARAGIETGMQLEAQWDSPT